MIDAFGTIALVAMMPTVTIQLVGLIYKIKLNHSKAAATAAADEADILIIEGIGEEYYNMLSRDTEASHKSDDITEAVNDDDIDIIDFPVDYISGASDDQSSDNVQK